MKIETLLKRVNRELNNIDKSISIFWIKFESKVYPSGKIESFLYVKYSHGFYSDNLLELSIEGTDLVCLLNKAVLVLQSKVSPKTVSI